MRTILFAVLGLISALPAFAQQSAEDAKAAEAERQRDLAVERCEAHRGSDCVSDAGLSEWLQNSQPKSADEAKRQRDLAIERCKAHRGTDCDSDAGLAEWLLNERSQADAKSDGSRSIYQTAPRPTPRGN